MLSYTAMTVADSVFVGRLGTVPLAAIGLAATLVHLMTAFGNGLLGGVRVTVARAVGREQHARARELGWQGVWLALALGVPVAALAALGAPAFQWMGASTEVTTLASAYYGWRTLAAPLVFLGTALSGWFQARGDTYTPMVAAVLGNIANIVLDPLLIFGHGPVAGMGITGAALATVFGQSLMVMTLMIVGLRQLLPDVVPPRRELIHAISRVGTPTGVQYTLNVASFTAFSALLAHSGDAHLAANVIAVRILMISFLPGLAIGQAAGVLVGQSLGGGRPHRARWAFRAAVEQAMLVMGTCGLVFLAAPGLLIGVFSPELEVAVLVRQLLVVAAAIQLLDAIATTALCSLTGAGDTRFVMYLSIGCAWLIKLPIAAGLVLGAELGVLGAWLGLAVEVAMIALLSALRVGGSAWLSQQASTEVEAVPLN
jgi:MATE family multidrug resistance protein